MKLFFLLDKILYVQIIYAGSVDYSDRESNQTNSAHTFFRCREATMRIKAVCNMSFLCAFVLITAFSSLAQGGRKCWIKSMVGDVKVQRSKSPKWIKARVNMPLREKDAIRTFVESEALIQTADGHILSLKENTTLELSVFIKDTKGAKKTNVKILSGDLMANVKKLTQKKSKFSFETPTAVAAIRGTKVGFDVEKDKTDIRVY